ncbi:hypothetical protein R3P38DRAFT_3026313 [Favolaschia claudopus]|uniref:F-box domain-containing protein n=1 Tax=Favolaschia claudopus TaxID=2862362 RepID=A0AAW0AEV8_9AGAR
MPRHLRDFEPLASLMDLPEELLLHIFEQSIFPPESLYYMALLNRRLHFPALSVYFSRHGIDLATKSVTIHAKPIAIGWPDSLSALRIYLCLDSLDLQDITCVLPHPSCASTRQIVAHMNRLQCFMSRLSSVKTVKLEFGDDHWELSMCLSTGTDEALGNWALEFGGLLNCTVTKGCESFTLVNGTYMAQTYDLVLSNSLIPRWMRRIFPARATSASNSKFRRSSTQGTITIRLPAVTQRIQLKSLTIHSATLLLPPGLDWTLSALRQSRLTSLALSIPLPRLGNDTLIWQHILPLVASAAPHLTSLSIKRVQGEDADIFLAFAARLAYLTTLDLDFHHWSRNFELSKLNRPMKRLTSLHTIPVVVEHLLAHSALPSIRSISLIWWMMDDTTFHESFIRPTLSNLRRLSPLHATCPLHISLSIVDREISSFADRTAPYLSASQDRFPLIQRIQMHGKYRDLVPLRHTNPLIQFLSLFPCIIDLELDTDETFPESDVLELMQSLGSHPSLERIFVDGRTYSVSTS